MERRRFPGAPSIPAQHARLHHASSIGTAALILFLFSCSLVAGDQQSLTRRQQSRLDDAMRREGEAVVDLADAAMKGRATPSDFTLEWRNDFLKAQPGTFVPFTVTVDAGIRTAPAILMYVRVVERQPDQPRGRLAVAPAYEAIYPIERDGHQGHPLRIRRGFAVAPGRYTVYVVMRERPLDLLDPPRGGSRRAAVLVQPLDVPDFWTGSLTTSTLMLAERVEQLAGPLAAGRLEEDPYVVGTSRIHPAPAAVFRRETELIVVFLVYNPAVGPEKHFDVQVDYHLYRKLRDGERYVTRTNPQRFNPSLMGAHFDPTSGQPVLAGQGILLAEFDVGDYRLGITVTDLLSRKTVTRDVTFSVIGS